MIKTLLSQVKQYKKASLLAPLFTALEVLMEVLIPFVTASIIDKGIEAGNITQVYIYGGISVWDLAVLFGCLTVTTLFIGGVSILFSALLNRTTMATVLSYLAVVFTVAGTYLVLVFVFKIYSLIGANGAGVPENAMEPWNYLLLLNPAVTFYSLFSQQIGNSETMSFLNWYSPYLLADKLSEPYWIWLSCGIQLAFAILFIWLAAYVINPMHRKSQ